VVAARLGLVGGPACRQRGKAATAGQVGRVGGAWLHGCVGPAGPSLTAYIVRRRGRRMPDHCREWNHRARFLGECFPAATGGGAPGGAPAGRGLGGGARHAPRPRWRLRKGSVDERATRASESHRGSGGNTQGHRRGPPCCHPCPRWQHVARVPPEAPSPRPRGWTSTGATAPSPTRQPLKDRPRTRGGARTPSQDILSRHPTDAIAAGA